MIKVKRGAAPGVLTQPGGKGELEKKKAEASLRAHLKAHPEASLRAHLEAHPDEAAEWTFEFKAYKDSEVKAALEALFHGKCAYCESHYRGTQPVDVEHWRPKGRTVPAAGAEPQKPAYWWLAAAWENLLPSCIDCNRKREQHDVDEDKPLSIGKKDEFPLFCPKKRAKASPEEEEEDPLLLDPCSDDPAKYLEFDPDGCGVLRPRDDSERPLRRASESIRVYALNRVGLVLNRQELARRLQLRIATIKVLARILVDLDPPESIRLIIEERLTAEMRELARARRPDQPYSLLARQLVDRQMAELEALAVGDALREG